MSHVRLCNQTLKLVLRSTQNLHRPVIIPAIATRSLPLLKTSLARFDQPSAWISTSNKKGDESVAAEIVSGDTKKETKV